MSVVAAVESLPTSGLTISALQALDNVVPGAWENTVDFDAIVSEVSGETKPAVVAAIRERALSLESAPHYGRALQVFAAVDKVDQVAAGAAALGTVSSLLGNVGFLQQFTPKPETTQSVDAAVKLGAELIGFGLLNDMPTSGPDGLARFAGALQDYARYDLMRIAAWVVFDGMLPLGPDFLAIITRNVREAGTALTENAAFSSLSGQLPGDSSADKRQFLLDAIDTTGDWVGRFVEEKNLTQKSALDSLQGVLGVAGGGLDVVAAAIDASTNYYAHTGTQTVARTLARDAHRAVKQDVWDEWVAAR